MLLSTRLKMFGLLALAGTTTLLSATVVPAPIFNDEMILQRDTTFPVWGRADAGETVTVEFAGQKHTTTADADGRWSVTFQPLPASAENRVMTISGSDNRIEIKDVVVGEVWLCSGQSNMEMPLWTNNPRWRTIDGDKYAAAANYPDIRIIRQPRKSARLPQEQGDLDWQRLSPANAAEFSAAAFFFGTNLQRELNVPIGLLGAYWGGTRIEPWTPPVGFNGVPELANIAYQVNSKLPGTPEYKAAASKVNTLYSNWLVKFNAAAISGGELPQPPAFPSELLPGDARQAPTVLYNQMIHPFVPYALRGVIWYQGCANLSDGPIYRRKMDALLDGWREVFNNPRMPFFFVQLAPYNYGEKNEYKLPVIWETQQKFADSRDQTVGMAVINDVGNPGDIHPQDKKTVGERLARLALNRVYGRSDVKADSPALAESRIEGNTFVLKFKHAESLKTPDNAAVENFEIAGADGQYHPATAVIDGNTLRVSAADVAEPVMLRYMWGQTRKGNLYNEADLPLGAFRVEPPSPSEAILKELEKTQQLVFDYDLIKASYLTNNAKQITTPFKRVTYLVTAEPIDGSGEKWLAVTLDAFTSDPAGLGVPVAGKPIYQKTVTNLVIRGNAPNVEYGEFPTGNIEFWPHNYVPKNGANVAGASDQLYDFGDSINAPEDGYGSMQLHNTAKQQTIFAYNSFKKKANADFGFGNSNNANSRDWTFSSALKNYSAARIRVFVGN